MIIGVHCKSGPAYLFLSFSTSYVEFSYVEFS